MVFLLFRPYHLIFVKMFQCRIMNLANHSRLAQKLFRSC